MHTHTHTSTCSRLISIFRLPHSRAKGLQRLPYPAPPLSLPHHRSSLLCAFGRSLALRRLIKNMMEREGWVGMGREISLLILAHFNLHSVSSSSSSLSSRCALCLVFFRSVKRLRRQMECVLAIGIHSPSFSAQFVSCCA